VCFVCAASILPELPVCGGLLSLLFVLEGNADVCTVLADCARHLIGCGVANGEFVRLALVEVGHRNVVLVLRHGSGGEQRGTEAKSGPVSQRIVDD